MTLSSDRYVLPLKADFKGRVQGTMHDCSQTGETCYFDKRRRKIRLGMNGPSLWANPEELRESAGSGQTGKNFF
ncbi:MAG: hypothetical protein LBV65_03720 [Desulfovibrio sp.]|jgi:hypothetical protein|nr:hypothetical protein [Desulfovibrio sp.]